MSNQRYKLTFYLLGQIGRGSDKDFRAELCVQASANRTQSLSDLSDAELIELNNHLRRLAAVPEDALQLKIKRQRRKFFSICHDLNWETLDGKLNYDKINTWLLKFGYLHKPLNDYTEKELPQLITQIENIQRKDYEKS